MKTCTKCEIEKQEEDFWKNSKSLDGFQAYCRDCAKLLLRTKYKDTKASCNKRFRTTGKHKEAKNRWQREDRKRNPEYYRIRELSVKIRNRNPIKGFRRPKYNEFKEILGSLPKFCINCGATEGLTLDHIIPLSKGGDPFARENLTTLCISCNSSKGNKLVCNLES